MKKLFYIIMLTVVSAFSFTACTEEEVAPTESQSSPGGLPSDKM